MFVNLLNLKGESVITTALLALKFKFESEDIVGVPVPVSINVGAYIGPVDIILLAVIDPVISKLFEPESHKR